MVIHLERQIEIQKAKLARQERQKRDAEAQSNQMQDALEDVSASIQLVNTEAEAKLLLWRDGIAELHRKDEQLQVCLPYDSPTRVFVVSDTDILCSVESAS